MNKNDLQDLINQLPSPFTIVGDLNAKSPIWGNDPRNQQGRIVENLLTVNICIANTRENTHFDARTGSESAIDIKLTLPEIVDWIEWRVLGDLFGSDHYPVVVSEVDGEAATILRQTRYIEAKANWRAFKRETVTSN